MSFTSFELLKPAFLSGIYMKIVAWIELCKTGQKLKRAGEKENNAD